MAEHVTNVNVIPGRDGGRLRQLLDRFPGGVLEARGVPPRDADGVFAMLKASRGRLPVARVVRHVCRHDEGIGSCTIDQEG